jgi:hypothetical protein
MRRSEKAVVVLGDQGSISSPLQLQNLWGWWDLSDITTLFQDLTNTTPVTANDDVVGHVRDKSGRGEHITADFTTHRPLYKTGIQNSRSATLHGSGAAIKGWDTANAIDSDDFSVACVLKSPATITGGTAYGFISNWTSTTPVGNQLSISTGGAFVGRTAPTDATVTGAAASTSTAYVVAYTVTPTSRALYVNGAVAVTSTTAATPTDQVLRFGTSNLNTGASFWTGHLGEIVAYDAALSHSQMAVVIAYLNTRWAVF